MAYIRFKREGRTNWEIARTEKELAWKLEGGRAEVVYPANGWFVRAWRKLFPLKGNPTPLGKQSTSLTDTSFEKLVKAVDTLFQIFMTAGIIVIASSVLTTITVVAFADVWKTVDIELRTLIEVLQIGFGLSLVALCALLRKE